MRLPPRRSRLDCLAVLPRHNPDRLARRSRPGLPRYGPTVVGIADGGETDSCARPTGWACRPRLSERLFEQFPLILIPPFGVAAPARLYRCRNCRKCRKGGAELTPLRTSCTFCIPRRAE